MSIKRKILTLVLFIFCSAGLYALSWLALSNIFQANVVSHFYRDIELGRAWGAIIIPIYFSIPLGLYLFVKNREILKIILGSLFLWGVIGGVFGSFAIEGEIFANTYFQDICFILAFLSAVFFTVFAVLGSVRHQKMSFYDLRIFTVFFSFVFGLCVGGGFAYSPITVLMYFLGFCVVIGAGFLAGSIVGGLTILIIRFFSWLFKKISLGVSALLKKCKNIRPKQKIAGGEATKEVAKKEEDKK